jgi:PAS domain S-box-containing protein
VQKDPGIMDIRKKTAIIIGLTLVGLILVLLLLSEMLVVGEFNAIETRSTENDMYRVITAISYDLSQMDTMVHEWANTPSVQTYFSNPSSSPVPSLLDDSTFERLQYNVIIFFDANGTVIAEKMYDLNTHQEMPLPESFIVYTRPTNRFFEQSDALRLNGIVKLSDGPMFVSMRSVQSDSDGGKTVGSILTGRYFDQQVLYQISLLTNTALGKYQYADPNLPQDVIDTMPKIPQGEPFFISNVGEDSFEVNAPMYTRPVNETYVATYARINDIFNSPAIIVRMTVPRAIYTEGRQTTTSFVILLFFACLTFGIAILLLIENTVLSRISRMSREVSTVGSTEDAYTRVSSGGTDEIGRLATSINWMLKELEAAHAKLKSRLIQTEDRYRVIFNSNNDIVFVFSLPDSEAPAAMVEVNDAGCARLGYTREEFLALRPESVVAHEPDAVISRLAHECAQTDHVNLETTFITKTGETVPVEVYAHIVLQLGRPAILAIGHDITERLHDEQLKSEAFQQIEDNMEKFAILNDHIRNPLQVIMFCSTVPNKKAEEEIIKQITLINEIIDKLDKGYLESEKVRNFLRTHYEVRKK